MGWRRTTMTARPERAADRAPAHGPVPLPRRGPGVPAPEGDPRIEAARSMAAQRDHMVTCATGDEDRLRSVLLEARPALEALADLSDPHWLSMLASLGGPRGDPRRREAPAALSPAAPLHAPLRKIAETYGQNAYAVQTIPDECIGSARLPLKSARLPPHVLAFGKSLL